MNTYSDNLRSAIYNTLQTLQLNNKAAAAQYEAAKATLQYAQEAVKASQQKQAGEEQQLKEQTAILHATEQVSYLCNNVLSATTTAHRYTQQAMTNTAVSAANVQAAANSIVKLAGDAGSIFSIINAADHDTDIYELAKEARELMNILANEAEEYSLLAMNTSVATAEIASGSLQDMSKTTADLATKLLKQQNDSTDTLSNMLIATSATLTADKATESTAQVAYDIANTNVKAANEAYTLTNTTTNQALTVDAKDAASITVSFREMVNPFDNSAIADSYYLFFVKADKQAVFGIQNAENLVANQEGKQALKVDATAVKGNITQPADPKALHLRDTDGDLVAPGISYVVFLLAIFTDNYKKHINNFEDWLSAPSTAFSIDGTEVKGNK